MVATAEEIAGRAFGIDPAEPWGSRYSGAEVALRMLGMVVLAPVAEELLFRGLLFREIGRTRLGPWGAVAATALLFALLHFQYYGPALALVLVDGLFLGTARQATGSVDPGRPAVGIEQPALLDAGALIKTELRGLALLGFSEAQPASRS